VERGAKAGVVAAVGVAAVTGAVAAVGAVAVTATVPASAAPTRVEVANAPPCVRGTAPFAGTGDAFVLPTGAGAGAGFDAGQGLCES